MVRRVLLVASMMVLLWAAPAHAQSYGDVLGNGEGQNGQGVNGQGQNGQGVSGNEQEQGANQGGAGRRTARTGQDNIVPLVQAGLLMVGGGTLLLFVARRRRIARRVAV